MISLQMLVPIAAAVSSLVLAALALAARPRLRIQWMFALGMLGFAVESVLAFMLLTAGNGHGAIAWLSAVHIAGLLLLLPWAFFVAMLADLQMPMVPRSWRLGLGLGVALTVTAATAVALWPAFTVDGAAWSATGAVLLAPARTAAVVQLLLTVGVLTGLEVCLRTSRGTNRRRVKYLVLGLGGIFLIRFYILSQALLFQSVLPIYLKTSCATLFLGTLLLAIPIARDQLRGTPIGVSRQIVYRSVVFVLLGLYLFVVAALGSVLTYLQIPEETFWGSIVVFVSALALTAVLLSDRLRWRLQRFVAFHFYRTKYDYRQQWMLFTKRMSSRLTAAEIGRELIDGVAEASGATAGAVYLSESAEAPYRLWGHIGASTFVPALAGGSAMATWVAGQDGSRLLPPEVAGSLASPPLPSGIAAPLRWRDSVIGFIVLGPERGGREYTLEDLDFLSTVAEQAAGTLVTARLSESIAQAREVETVDRVTGAVIHDIKNSVSALSMLSRNALRHFNDPEFQRDAITTLARTVDRMRRVLAKLSAPGGETQPLRMQAVDLADVVLEATAPLAGDSRIRLVRELGAVGKVTGDREALLRVVQNLVTNATEAIRAQGTLAVTLAEAQDQAMLTVSDTGCGIPEDFLRHHLFSPFRSTKQGGWGIGLFQSRQIVERHQGEILVDSIEGTGTTFRVKLPLRRETDSAADDVALGANVWETVR